MTKKGKKKKTSVRSAAREMDARTFRLYYLEDDEDIQAELRDILVKPEVSPQVDIDTTVYEDPQGNILETRKPPPNSSYTWFDPPPRHEIAASESRRFRQS